jgi:hypothetical protein
LQRFDFCVSSSRYSFKAITAEKWKRPMNPQLEPLTITVTDARQLSRLSNASIYKMIAEGRVETTVVMGRRLIVYESFKRALGIVPGGACTAAPGLTGGSIKRSPGRHRKQRAGTGADLPAE